jgi:hypothetical protein
MKNVKLAIALALITTFSAKLFAQGITINGSVSMVVNNASLNNNGKFTANTSTVKFTGNTDTASSFVFGKSPTNFYNLTVVKSNYGLASRKNTCTNNSPILSSGNLYINNYLIMSNSVLINNRNSVQCKPKTLGSN